MTTVLIIAHAPLASALKAVAQHAYPDCAADVQALDVPRDATESALQATTSLPQRRWAMPWLSQ